MAQEKPGLTDQIRNLYNRLSISQKVFIVLVTVITVAAVFIFTRLARTIDYGVLFSNLNQSDSGLILEKLKEAKTPYSLSSDGSTIRIPRSQVAETRIELASAGLPQGGGVGFEIFDKTSLATTDFVQNINYLRALEGELARSITKLSEVESAKVHISLQKKSVFLDEQEAAKASVVLNLRPGTTLQSSVVPAIVHLVAQSVEGLHIDNIAVIDVQGRLLSRPRSEGSDEFEENASNRFAYQRRFEENLKKKVFDLLEPIVGYGKVRADIKVNLDFNKIETKEEVVDPEATAKRSEQTETFSSSGAAGGGGVPGVAANVAGAENPLTGAASQGGARSKSEKSTVNYEVSRKVTHHVAPVGEIKNLSVAVVVDDAIETVINEGRLEKSSRPRSEVELEKLQKIVQAAVGYSQDRGDRVEIANFSFDTSMETESSFFLEKQKSADLIRSVITYAIILVGLVLFFLLILKPLFRRASLIMRSSPALETSMDVPRIDVEKLSELKKAQEDNEIEKELLEKYRVPKEAKKISILKERVREFARDNPDNTASLIKSYLAEDR